jgi:hypothetical protein
VCIYSCLVKCEFRPPCEECLAEWAESTWDLHNFSRICRAHRRLLDVQTATDQEWQDHLDQVCPVVPATFSMNFTRDTEQKEQREQTRDE